MPKKKSGRRSSRGEPAAASTPVSPPAVTEEVVLSSKRKRERASKSSKRKRSSAARAESAEPDGGGEKGTPQRAAAAAGGGSGSRKKKSSTKRAKASTDPFNARASAAHLGLDIVDDDAAGGAAATSPAAAAVPDDDVDDDAPAPEAAERRWLELTPERIVRLGRGGSPSAVRVLLRLVDAEYAVLEGFYRVRVLRGSASIGAYELGPADGWQPVFATATSVHYVQAVAGRRRRGSASELPGSGAAAEAEAEAASSLWQLAPKQSGAVIALESVLADGLPVPESYERAGQEPLSVLPPAEGRAMRDLGLGLELCRLVPPPPSSPQAEQQDTGNGKPSTTKPAVAPPEWEHVRCLSSVAPLHPSLAQCSILSVAAVCLVMRREFARFPTAAGTAQRQPDA
jgi:hypothetical protein